MVDPSQVALLAVLTPIIVAVLSHLVAKLPRNGAMHALPKGTVVVERYSCGGPTTTASLR